MIIDNELKNKITKNNINKNYDENYKILFKLYNSNQNNVYDKWYVLYGLAITCKKINRIKESKMYIAECMDIVNNSCITQYDQGRTYWLHTELFKSGMSEDELLGRYNALKEYFVFMGDDDYTILGLDANIAILTKDVEGINMILDICWSKHKCSDHYIGLMISIGDELKEKELFMYNKIKERIPEGKAC